MSDFDRLQSFVKDAYKTFTAICSLLASSPGNVGSVSNSRSHHGTSPSRSPERLPVRVRAAPNGQDFEDFVGKWTRGQSRNEDLFHTNANSISKILTTLMDTSDTEEHRNYSSRYDTLSENLTRDKKKSRGNAANTFEKDETQPFVNGILAAALPVLSAHHASILASSTGDLGRMDETGSNGYTNAVHELVLFTKIAPGINGSATSAANHITEQTKADRRPDAAFCRLGNLQSPGNQSGTRPARQGRKPVRPDFGKLDRAARSKNTYFTVEAKSTLDASHNLAAFIECERDLAAISSVPADKLRAGFSIVTDGMNWYFLRIAWKLRQDITWEREVVISEKVTIHPKGSFIELAEWLLFILESSMAPTVCTDLGKTLCQETNGLSLSLNKIFSHDGNRSTTSCWRVKGDDVDALVVLKACQIFGFPLQAARDEKNRGYMRKETALLRNFAQSGTMPDCFPKISLLESRLPSLRDGGLWLEYSGEAIGTLEIGGERGRVLAAIVYRDIYCRALAFLAARNLCHGDIHEHNILISSDRAVLIDFESAVDFNDSLSNSPVKYRCAAITAGAKEVDELIVSGLVTCLAKSKCTDFKEMKTLVQVESFKEEEWKSSIEQMGVSIRKYDSKSSGAVSVFSTPCK
jgi:predicted Ser/Thr protein kinase